jgi:hypothetical protein
LTSLLLFCVACRQLASKAAQALLLLRTIVAGNVNRLVNRLDADTKRALRDLVRGECSQLAECRSLTGP